jgi:3-oxoacyl-[acyl-carrier-protein] synthase II
MQASERRVVITGIGLISPLGIGPEANWAALAEGRGAVAPIRAFPVDAPINSAVGEVSHFDPKSLALPQHKRALTKSLKYMARDIQLAVAAAELAFSDAGLVGANVDPTRIGIDLGAGLISTELDELAPAINHAYQGGGSFDFQTWGKSGIPQITPIWLLKYLPNMLACHISILNDCQGPSNSITEGEAASLLALGEAYRIIARGRADVMVTGGADSKIHPLSIIRANLMGSLSTWDGDPSGSCRPFDSDRSGWVGGEGAGILIIEELEHAQKRGARIYGEVLGFGSACDASPDGGIDPNGVGLELAMKSALRDASLRPAEMGHVNAHGAGTVTSDLAEARALARLFGAREVPVTALKGYMGNLASGCGAVELIQSLLGVARGLLPTVLNCDTPDPQVELDLVLDSPRPVDNRYILKNSLTRMGQAASVVISAEPLASA